MLGSFEIMEVMLMLCLWTRGRLILRLFRMESSQKGKNKADFMDLCYAICLNIYNCFMMDPLQAGLEAVLLN